MAEAEARGSIGQADPPFGLAHKCLRLVGRSGIRPGMQVFMPHAPGTRRRADAWCPPGSARDERP